MTSVMRRTAAAAALITATAVLGPLQPATSAGPGPGGSTGAGADTLRVTGRVLVLPGEGGGRDSYFLRLRSGRIVALADGFTAEPLSWFTGTLSVPGTSSARALSGARRSSALARAQALGGLEVRQARVIAPRPASGPTTHTTYVAKVTNFGTIGSTDADILGGLAAAQQYWVAQSGGWITGWSTGSGVAAVASSAGSAAAGCGLANNGADMPAIADSVGATAFPGVDFCGDSANHLVIVVPQGCGDGTAVGRGQLGTSLANGGPVIIQAIPGVGFRTVLEHEYGHNVGLEHSNNIAAEYGGLYEVMGAGPETTSNPALGTVYRYEQGILAAGETVDGLGGGTWALAPRSATTGLRGIHFINPDDGRRHFVDYRNGAGTDAGSCYSIPDYCNYSTGRYRQSYRPGVVIEREDTDRGSFLLAVAGNDGSLQAGESWTNAGGSISVTASSANTVRIIRTPKPPLPAGSAAILGTPVPYKNVQATASVAGATAVRYQWLLNGQPIAQADDPTFMPTPAMAGGALSVIATGYAVGRDPSPPVQSAPQTVALATWHALGARRYPEIAGSLRVGQTLTALGLDWVDNRGRKPAGYATTYVWLRNRKPISGATGPSYRLTSKDKGESIVVREYPRAPSFATATYAGSAGTKRIAIGKLTTARPKIKGKARVGKVVKAATPGWTTATRFRYQWFVNGNKIARATKRKLVLTRSLRGKKIQVKVTGKKKGYTAASKRSKRVRVR